jgi:hypothetical protein
MTVQFDDIKACQSEPSLPYTKGISFGDTSNVDEDLDLNMIEQLTQNFQDPTASQFWNKFESNLESMGFAGQEDDLTNKLLKRMSSDAGMQEESNQKWSSADLDDELEISKMFASEDETIEKLIKEAFNALNGNPAEKKESYKKENA